MLQELKRSVFNERDPSPRFSLGLSLATASLNLIQNQMFGFMSSPEAAGLGKRPCVSLLPAVCVDAAAEATVQSQRRAHSRPCVVSRDKRFVASLCNIRGIRKSPSALVHLERLPLISGRMMKSPPGRTPSLLPMPGQRTSPFFFRFYLKKKLTTF